MKALFLVSALALGLQGEVYAQQVGNNLAARQFGGGRGGGGGGRGGGSGGGAGGGSNTCTWTGHCIGDPCQTENDCDLDYICRSSRCAASGSGGGQTQAPSRPTTSSVRRLTTTVFVTASSRRPTTTARPPTGGGQSCEWEGHCLNDPCQTENDCDGQLTCARGRCANPGSTLVTATRGPTAPVRTTVVTVVPSQRPTSRPTGGGGGGTPACGDNPLACIGVSCRTDYDCGFELIICKNGVCGL